MKKALITGITGQDGSYLADILLSKGYQVHGIIRRNSTSDCTDRINYLLSNPKITLHYGDLTDFSNITSIIQETRPDEIYNLAAQSHVKVSFSNALYTADVDALGVCRILEALRVLGMINTTKFYQASTSEMYGLVQAIPQREDTKFHPRSPYGVAKLYAHWITKNYRESYDMFAVSGILFNHESERRGIEFVTRKITDGVARIALGLSDSISLGNLDAKRDWGYAPDFVEAAWMMLQQDTPDDYVIATGETRSIRDFLDEAFAAINIDDWTNYVKQDPRYFRPAEVDVLRGDYSKAKTELGWNPRTSFGVWVQLMVENDIHLLQP